jgi:hypothetical protein
VVESGQGIDEPVDKIVPEQGALYDESGHVRLAHYPDEFFGLDKRAHGHRHGTDPGDRRKCDCKGRTIAMDEAHPAALTDASGD